MECEIITKYAMVKTHRTRVFVQNILPNVTENGTVKICIVGIFLSENYFSRSHSVTLMFLFSEWMILKLLGILCLPAC